jgi:ATP adenylyltransferase
MSKQSSTSHNLLWAPWRSTYITQPHPQGCFLCDFAEDDEKLLLHKGNTCIVVMNLFPYNNGHLLIAPKKHKKDLSSLTKQEREELFFLIIKCESILKKKLSPEGFNIGANLGKIAGAGVPGHLHFHIVPRWKGDTNFMPVLGKTKIISQSLNQLYKLLKPEFQHLKE